MIISKSSGRQVFLNHLDMDRFQKARFWTTDRSAMLRYPHKPHGFSYPRSHQMTIMAATSGSPYCSTPFAGGGVHDRQLRFFDTPAVPSGQM